MFEIAKLSISITLTIMGFTLFELLTYITKALQFDQNCLVSLILWSQFTFDYLVWKFFVSIL